MHATWRHVAATLAATSASGSHLWVPPADADATWNATSLAAGQSEAAMWRGGWRLIIKLQLYKVADQWTHDMWTNGQELQLAASHDPRILEGVGGNYRLVEEKISSWLSTRIEGSCGINEIKRVISM
ncbi:hypothetical protein Tco_1210726 [Tanacetum coccineum]